MNITLHKTIGKSIHHILTKIKLDDRPWGVVCFSLTHFSLISMPYFCNSYLKLKASEATKDFFYPEAVFFLFPVIVFRLFIKKQDLE